jgi:prepilin-type N-terminal cleavage/methylation domain-containing protein
MRRPPHNHSGAESRAGSGSRGREGWTLIEMMAVLAILAVLAGVLAPVLVRELDRWVRKDEDARLKALSDGFQQGVMRLRQIPDATTWTTFVATQMGITTNDVRKNVRGNERLLLVDPALRIGTSAGSVLPFTQNWQGSLAPVSARILVVSSVGEPLPSGLQSDIAAGRLSFATIWNAGTDAVPSDWTWAGRGTDLCLQRIPLTPLFVEVVLNNFDGLAGRFGVDAGITNLMTTTSFSTWYLRATVLRLHGNNGLLQSAEVIQNPVSYVYENAKWHGRAFMSLGTKRLTGQDLQDAMEMFLAAPWNTNAKQGVRQADVVAALEGYMQQYLNWEDINFSYATSDIKPVKDAQTLVGSKTTDLIFKP